MSRTFAAVFLILAAGLTGDTRQARPTSTAGDARAQALRAIDESSAQLVQAVKQLEEMNQSFNMQYLGLQQQVQDESRRFALLNNIMKTRHDTAKNPINNIRYRSHRREKGSIGVPPTNRGSSGPAQTGARQD